MTSYTAFVTDSWLATGSHNHIVETLRDMPEIERASDILVFDDETGQQVDFDLRELEKESPAPKRGRPKLGVTSREVTLLPRHWEWLAKQPGGASAVLRKLVDAARKAGLPDRSKRDAAYHFLSAMAGDYPHFEESIRALYANDRARFETLTAKWPTAVRGHAVGLAWGE
ncbi:DUF2239 family protein [Parasphingopyxis algicola]|uniref:DUF2239 family protein n=1 Tax=Parasphingopyxis algicola TaxID=2026624 RepID=UPI0031B5752D